MRDARLIQRGVGVFRHHVARAPCAGNRLVRRLRDGDDLGGDLGGDLALQRRVQQRNTIHARIINNGLQRAPDQREIIKNRRRDIHRIRQRSERGHEFAQLVHRFRREFRKPHAARHALVGHQYARAARHRNHCNAITLRQFAAAEHAPVIGDILDVVHLNNAALFERRLVQRHRTAEVGGVRGGRFLPFVGVAHLPHQYRLARVHGFDADLRYARHVARAFEVARDNVGIRITHEVINKIERRHAEFVARGHHLPERKSAFGAQAQHRKAKAARLRHHGDAPRRIVLGEKHRAKSHPRLVSHVHHALTVGADDANIVLPRNISQPLLQRHALAAGF